MEVAEQQNTEQQNKKAIQRSLPEKENLLISAMNAGCSC